MNFSISGELGDTIMALPAIRALGGGNLYGVNRPWTRPDFSRRILSLKRLLESQNYMGEVDSHSGQPIDLDISPFRRFGLLTGQTIVERIGRFCRAKPDPLTPWIIVEQDKRSAGRIVINQCERWESWFFPWKEIVQTFGRDLLFIGSTKEHQDFCSSFGTVPYLATNDLYEAASLIAGAELFIGNQSCCNAIAEAMHKRKVLAACLYASDCFFNRAGATYCVDGSLAFEACGKSFSSPAIGFIPRSSNELEFNKQECLERCRRVMVQRGII